MKRVLVTGATGFIGSRLCEALASSGLPIVRAALRTDRSVPVSIAEKIIVGDMNSTTDWTQALDGVDAVIHTAARAHVLNALPGTADLYFETNERGTQCLAAAAAQAKVTRFVFLSSIKANGEESASGAYASGDVPHPQDDYGLSKWRAEQHLIEIARRTGMEAVIVRPPLVYGPGVRANFLRLLQWVDSGWPLPFGAVRNLRSLVSVWNPVRPARISAPQASERAWAHLRWSPTGEDLSTPALIRRIATALE